ncbi:MAG: ABC transporter permease [Lachnospiraceae bacterium]|nr:ABC transporter permease [Lachnospiraceae bacterium]
MNKKKKSIFISIIGDEKRQSFTIPVLAILIGLIVGGIIIAITGSNPFKAYYNILQGCGLAKKPSYGGKKGMITDFMEFVNYVTPMILAALSFAVSMKAGLFNIGISGQMMAAGFISTILVGYSELNAFVARPLVVLIGFIVGALVGGLVGYLKYQFNINEVVSTIMINYIFRYIITFFINTYYVDPVSRQSVLINPSARLSLLKVRVGDYKMTIPLGFIVAILAVVIIYILMEKTKTGFEIKAVGLSRNAAKYSGINVGKNIILAMVISGGLAGLAGVTYHLGYVGSIQPNTLISTGFDSIAVSLLGNNNPFGIILSSFFISGLDAGSTYMTSSSGVEFEIAKVISGVILVFSACSSYIKLIVNRKRDEIVAANTVKEERS